MGSQDKDEDICVVSFSLSLSVFRKSCYSNVLILVTKECIKQVNSRSVSLVLVEDGGGRWQ